MKTLLIDGNNVAHRAFWVGNSNDNRKKFAPDGTDVSMIYYFLNSLRAYARQFKTHDVFVAWDKKLSHGVPNFRKESTEGEYKGTRDNSNLESLYEQCANLVELLPSLGVKNIFPDILEGDDVLAWLAHNLEGEKVLISVDSDLLQLVNKNVSMFNLSTKKIVDLEHFGQITGIMSPTRFLLYKCALGDTADNIPGIPSYGKKRSKKLANNWPKHNLNEAEKDILRNNIALMDLSKGYTQYINETTSYQDQLDKVTEESKPDINAFKAHCERLGFNKFVTEINDWRELFQQKQKLAAMINKHFK